MHGGLAQDTAPSVTFGERREACASRLSRKDYGAGGVPVATHFTRSWKFAIATSVPKSQWP